MFHAPVATDDSQEPDAPLSLAEPVEFDGGNERLRAAHLHNGQVEARALFAPFLAVTAFAAALIVGWALYGSVPTSWLAGWVGLVAFANWVSCRSALLAARRAGSRTI